MKEPEASEASSEPVVAEEKVTAVVPTTDAGGADDFSSYAGAGMENVTSADLLVPRITVLQQLSPQLNDRRAEHIPGARQGEICDVGVGEAWPSIYFVPCYFEKVWIEWAPRASGKGLVEIHTSPAIIDRCTRDAKNRPMNGPNLVAETAQIYGFNLTAGNRRSFISMASTQLRTSRKWMALATGERLQRADGSTFVPPLFYRAYMLDSTMASNAEGDWWLLRANRAESLPELAAKDGPFPDLNWRDLRDSCAAFADSLRRGEAKADLSSLSPEGDGGAAPGDAGGEERAM
jgi:hypothetical protein